MENPVPDESMQHGGDGIHGKMKEKQTEDFAVDTFTSELR